jgi:hypothetical protein
MLRYHERVVLICYDYNMQSFDRFSPFEWLVYRSKLLGLSLSKVPVAPGKPQWAHQFCAPGVWEKCGNLLESNCLRLLRQVKRF